MQPEKETVVAVTRILLHQDLLVAEIGHARTAVLLVGPHQQEPLLAGFQIRFAIHDALLAPAFPVRLDFVDEKAPHRIAEHVVFFFEYQSFHGGRFLLSLEIGLALLEERFHPLEIVGAPDE